MPHPPPSDPDQLTGLILAGGRAQRLGGIDKGLLTVVGRPLIDWVIRALVPQVGPILISANRHLNRYRDFGYPVIPDLTPDYPGPLAGIASGLSAAPTDWVLCVPCDGPRPPPDLAHRLVQALIDQGGEIAVADDGTGIQPIYALIQVRLAASLADYLGSGERSVKGWYGRHRLAIADFADQPGAFRNLNTPADTQSLTAELRALGGWAI